MPCLRQTSAMATPTSCSRWIAITRFSENVDRFIVRPHRRSDFSHPWRRNRGSGHWVYRTANVLNKAPKPVQLALKAGLREIHGILTRATAEAAVDIFAEKYGAKCAKAAEWLTKDRDALLAFYDSPAEHWDHVRTSSPIESVFATVRHRTVRTKGSLSPTTARPTVFTLVMAASKTWRR